MKPDFTTRRGIDAEIMRLRRVISECETEGCDPLLIGMIGADIEALRKMKEPMLHPWEKARPQHEASLLRYGVTI